MLLPKDPASHRRRGCHRVRGAPSSMSPYACDASGGRERTDLPDRMTSRTPPTTSAPAIAPVPTTPVVHDEGGTPTGPKRARTKRTHSQPAKSSNSSPTINGPSRHSLFALVDPITPHTRLPPFNPRGMSGRVQRHDLLPFVRARPASKMSLRPPRGGRAGGAPAGPQGFPRVARGKGGRRRRQYRSPGGRAGARVRWTSTTAGGRGA